MRYQLHVNSKPAAPARRYWGQAAKDAVSSGYARWCGRGDIKIVSSTDATIELVEDRETVGAK